MSLRRFAVWIFAMGSGCATSGADEAADVRSERAVLRAREQGVIAVLGEVWSPPPKDVRFKTESQPFAAASRRVAENLTWTRRVVPPPAPLPPGTRIKGMPSAISDFRIVGSFPEQHRRLAKALFIAYGLRPDERVAVPDVGDGCILDLFDSASRLGVKIRGPGSMQNSTPRFTHAPPRSFELDDAEAAILSERGIRLFVQDASIIDGHVPDSWFPFVADLVRFLNAATPGPGVDLSGLLDHPPISAQLSRCDDRSSPAMSAGEASPSSMEIDVEEEGEVRLRCDGVVPSAASRGTRGVRALAFEARRTGNSASDSVRPATAGRASPEVRRRGFAFGFGWVRVEQRSNEDATSTSLSHARWGQWVLLPSTFERSQPFDVVFGVYPGRWKLSTEFFAW